jgi:hypothetical protein
MEGQACDDEEYENEGYNFQCNETIDGIKRCDLPESHPEFREAGYWELNGRKYLNTVLVKAWFRAFEELATKRDPSIEIAVTLTGSQSPREYNFETDAACFNLEITETHLEKIRERVFAPDAVGAFAKYLHEVHSSRSGYWSWMPCTLEDWKRRYGYWEGDEFRHRDNEFHRAVWALLDFWLLAFSDSDTTPSLDNMEANADDFRENLQREIESLRCNGALEDCFEFRPGKDAMEYGPDWDPSWNKAAQPAMITA